ncbi:immunoglobulin superfamily member 5 isoform X1 [Hyperolius riggenbachi]|uniref:immunoglobulin superfamily member 5 isoform X1 n=1 Tax=Hyperolius riggenbachi TaxID=752182 RepID=UPI0035A30AD5
MWKCGKEIFISQERKELSQSLMEGGGRICALVFFFLCIIQDFKSCAQIPRGPENATVLTGDNANFSCTVKSEVKMSLTWIWQSVNSVSVTSFGTIVSTSHIIARNSTNSLDNTFTSQITILNVNYSSSGRVGCLPLGSSELGAYLSVQVKGSLGIVNGSSVIVPLNSTVIIPCRASGWYPGPTITWEMNGTAANPAYYVTAYTTEAGGLVSAVSTFTIFSETNMTLTCLATIQTLPAPLSASVTVHVRDIIPGSLHIANGSSITVKPNSTVIIPCQASGWYPTPIITWEINNAGASITHYFTEYTPEAGDLVSAISTFTIIPETDMTLTCLATVHTLVRPLSTSVTILVRESVSGGSSLSQTDIILIAVFSSLGGLLLLAIIIAVIVICCKKKQKKRETGYQSDTWRHKQQDANNLKTIDRAGLGQRNYGYTPEPVSAAPSFRTNRSDSAYSDATSQTSNAQVMGRNRMYDPSKPIRHVTHV